MQKLALPGLQFDDTNLAYLCDTKLREGARARGDVAAVKAATDAGAAAARRVRPMATTWTWALPRASEPQLKVRWAKAISSP